MSNSSTLKIRIMTQREIKARAAAIERGAIIDVDEDRWIMSIEALLDALNSDDEFIRDLVASAFIDS